MVQPSLLFLSAIALPYAAASTLPVVGRNDYNVAISTAVLTDTGRLDPFAKDGSRRKIMLSSFSPVASCRRKNLQDYMPAATAAFEDEKFGAYGLPNGSFPALMLETCTPKASSPHRPRKEETFPLVFFSGALGTSRLLYNSMLQSIAAAGYLVVSIDHPYDADVVEFPDGTLVEGVDISDDALEAALVTRVDDIAFVHRQLGNQSVASALVPGYGSGCSKFLTQTVIVGHSFGGAAAAAAMIRLPSIRGGVNLDGTMFGSVLSTGLSRPFLLVGHENKTQETDPSWKATWPKLTGWKRELEVKGTAHYSFSDLPLTIETLGLQGHLPQEVGQLLGNIGGSRMMNLTVSYVTSFLDFVLKNKAHGVLFHGTDFPEVIVNAG
jgi:pimeloyl-ACP methyl ester carboxylesterase